MQRVTSMLPSWDKTKTGSKKGFDKVYGMVDKLGAPVNNLSNKIGSEAFWPTTLDKESDKAARILKSFCKDGFYAEEDRPSTEGVPKGKQRVLKKIPEKVIQNAVGLAIFTTMRTGLWVSGAGGSGVLIARKHDGEWSLPSGIMLHTAGLGFLVGVDIYDCVVVINNRKALHAFTKTRATIGGEISAVAGPVGLGGVLENDGKWKQANRPVFTYLKSRGFYAGIQVDGTVIIERTDENERFYGERVGVADILAGKVRHPPYETKMLMETIKAAEGRSDVDGSVLKMLDNQPAPADLELEEPGMNGPVFGVPEPDDPDPYGVLALEAEGFEIREAGTKSRPPSTQFEFNPSPTSPVFSMFNKINRLSIDTLTTKSNRESYMSNRSNRTRTSSDRATQTASMGTQTDDTSTPSTSPSRSDQSKKIIEEDEEVIVIEPEEVDYTKVDLTSLNRLDHSEEFDGTTVAESPRGRSSLDRRTISAETDTSYMTDEDLDDDDEEEPVIFEAASAQAQVITPQLIKARGGLVNIPKRPPPPPLPPRSMARSGMVDQGSGRSPMKDSFEEVDLHGIDRQRNDIPHRLSTVTPISALVADNQSPEIVADRQSLEISQGIVMKDLEKKDSPGPTLETFEKQMENELEFEHINNITPAVSTVENPNAHAALKISKDAEEDICHSVPAMPNEVMDVKPLATVV
ncbi:related to protein YSC84 [Rhynchosporium secalis]|uniref:Related to protein YSC84 n=1 Tax=Rhynchosporium secalis TaxID=38038 RepID=A0A1E1MUD6_RHYSE|nr:related to protein YSC84 [Rhynchosporium secalis]